MQNWSKVHFFLPQFSKLCNYQYVKDTILLSLKMIFGEYILTYDSLETCESYLCSESNDLSNFVTTCMYARHNLS